MRLVLVSDQQPIVMGNYGILYKINHENPYAESLNYQVHVRDVNVVCNTMNTNESVMYDAFTGMFATVVEPEKKMTEIMNKRSTPTIRLLMSLMTSTTRYYLQDPIPIIIIYARSMLWIYNHQQKTLNTYPIIPERYGTELDPESPLIVKLSHRYVTVHQQANKLIVHDRHRQIDRLLVASKDFFIVSAIPSDDIVVIMRHIPTSKTYIGTIRCDVGVAMFWKQITAVTRYLHTAGSCYSPISGMFKSNQIATTEGDPIPHFDIR